MRRKRRQTTHRQEPPTPKHPGRAAYWQVAAGTPDRPYADAFLRYGLAFVGGAGKVEAMAKVRAGDIMILKEGTSRVRAVGRVAEREGRCGGNGDKAWLRDFDGWDLSAYRFVDWRTPPEPIPAPGLTRSSINRANFGALRAAVDRMLAECPPAPAPAAEPRATREVGDDEILAFLVRRGLRPAAAEELTAALRRTRALARYYRDACDPRDVREHETRTFLILPLLIALGWAEQQLKVELATERSGRTGRIDVACFRRPYRRDPSGRGNNEDCALIVESKGFQFGLARAPAQARDYAASFTGCRSLAVSNGYCYKLYTRAGDGAFSATPSAYLNLLSPRDAYPLDPDRVGGCFEALGALAPMG